MTEKQEEKARIELSLVEGYLVKQGDKFFKLKSYEMMEDGKTIKREIYEEVNPKDLKKRIKNLAANIAKCPAISVADILADMLTDQPLDRLVKIEEAFEKELQRARESGEVPEVGFRTGYCTELDIGKDCSVVVRENETYQA